MENLINYHHYFPIKMNGKSQNFNKESFFFLDNSQFMPFDEKNYLSWKFLSSQTIANVDSVFEICDSDSVRGV